MSVEHKDAEIGKRHPVANWSYANEAARLAATGFTTADIGKYADQLDDHSVWKLVDDSPITWEWVGGALDSLISLATPTRTITADDTLDPANDGVIIVNGSADITIDDVAPTAGQRTSFRIHNIGTDGYAVIFEPAGGRTVNGAADYTFSSNSVLHIDWDGSNWVAG